MQDKTSSFRPSRDMRPVNPLVAGSRQAVASRAYGRGRPLRRDRMSLNWPEHYYSRDGL